MKTLYTILIWIYTIFIPLTYLQGYLVGAKHPIDITIGVIAAIAVSRLVYLGSDRFFNE